jgi:putative heme-binding domain-containing protein
LARLASKCEILLIRKFIARRLCEDIETNPGPLNELLNAAVNASEEFQIEVLTGMTEALRGWQKAKKPLGWDALLPASANSEIRERVRELGVVFGDGRALDEVKSIALDDQADLGARRAALQALIASRPPDLRAICEKLMRVHNLGAIAIRGLASFDDPAIGERLAGSYRQFQPQERRAVVEALVSRRSFAGALLDEMAAQRIPRADVTRFDARQIRSFNDPALTRRLEEVWGFERETSEDRRKFIAELKAKLTPAVLQAADKVRGRSIFTNACAVCHVLYGEGGHVGPDLTGAGRDNLDYLLENIVDPSAMVSADFRMTVVELKDGRTINGLISARTDRTITLKTQTDTMTIERKDIERMQDSSLSIMPEGLLESLEDTQRRDLLAFLMSKSP